MLALTIATTAKGHEDFVAFAKEAFGLKLNEAQKQILAHVATPSYASQYDELVLFIHKKQKAMPWSKTGESLVYERVAAHYGLSEKELDAFVRANDRGATFAELAEVLAQAEIPHTRQMTPDRLRIEAATVKRIKALHRKVRKRAKG